MSNYDRLRKEIEDMRQAQKGEFNAIMTALDKTESSIRDTKKAVTGYHSSNDRIVNKLISGLDQNDARFEKIEQRLDRLEEKSA
jgi:tetrahydromethanopterin S-methyltransferase subunit G